MIEIILNPNGACGQAGKVWDRIEPQFVHSKKPYRVHISHGEDLWFQNRAILELYKPRSRPMPSRTPQNS